MSVTPASTRLKQALMAIGTLTVLAGVAMASLFAYLWWDTKTTEVQTDFEDDFDDIEAAETSKPTESTTS